MKNLTLTDVVRKGTMAEFQYFRNGYLYYNIEILEGDHKGEVYQLCLDSVDFSSTDLNRTEKSSIFMRWIRETMKENLLTRVN